MHGLKLFGMAALVAQKNDPVARPSTALGSVKTVDHEDAVFGRRRALQSIFGGVVAAAAIGAQSASALDMDAFMSSELEKDKVNCDPKKDPKCIPKLSADEALCKYGQSGNARGEACKRVKQQGGELPSATKTKSLGGAYAM